MSTLLTLLVQVPDDTALRELLDDPSFLDAVDLARCSLIVVEDGRVTEIPRRG